MLRNISRFALTGAFGEFFTFFGKLAVGAGTAFLCWFILTNWVEVKDKIYSAIIPTIACFIIAYMMACLFLSVYDLACSAILQCFLVDEETAPATGAAGKNRPPSLEPFIKGLREDIPAVPDKKT